MQHDAGGGNVNNLDGDHVTVSNDEPLRLRAFNKKIFLGPQGPLVLPDVVVLVVLVVDHLEGPASCKLSSGGDGLLQMIIRRSWPLANYHP